MVDDTLNEEQKLKLISEVEEINSHGIQSDWLQDVAINDEATIYTYMLPNNVESVIACSETLDGAKKYDITEGNLHNEVIITENNKVYLDGFEVKLSQENEIENEISLLANGSTIYDVDRCPYGSPSDYTQYQGQIEQKNAELGQRLETMTISALALLISTLVGIYVPPAGIQASIAFGVATDLITNGKNSGVQSTSISWKIKRYYYKTGKFAVHGTLCVQKMVGVFFTNKNYTGEKTNKTYFNCKEYY